MVATVNARVLFNSVPSGHPEPGKTTITDKSQTIDIDAVPLNGGVLVKAVAFSVDPYMRMLMHDADPEKDKMVGLPGWVIGKPIDGLGIAKVLRSESSKFTAGQHVHGFLSYAEYVVIPDPSQLQVLPEGTGLPWSSFLSVAGMTSQTAYMSWKEYLGDAKAGQVIFISTGAGAVGSIVIQIAKKHGLKVIASAGSDKKVEFMKSLGADVAFNYKTASTQEVLSKEGPIDIYFDNVGGETLNTALANANHDGIFLLCGSISEYNLNGEHIPITNFHYIKAKNLTIKAFNMLQLMPKYGAEFYATVPAQAAKGELKWKDHIYKGLDGVHQALADVQTGNNEGKAVAVVSDD